MLERLRDALKSASQKRYVKTLAGWAIFVCIALILEVTLFNHAYWQTKDLKPEVIAEDVELSVISNDPDGKPYAITFNEPYEVRTLDIQLSEAANVNFYIKDDGRKAVSYKIEKEIFPDIEATHAFMINTYGKMRELAITVQSLIGDVYLGDVDESKIMLDRLVINQPIAFDFSFMRFGAIMVLGLLVWGFSSKRAWFKMPIFMKKEGADSLKLSRIPKAVLISTGVVIFVVLCLPIFNNTDKLGYFQEASLEYKSETKMISDEDELSAIDQPGGVEIIGSYHLEDSPKIPELEYVYQRAYEDQYSLLARALTHGHLDLMIKVSDELLEADDPYDMTERESFQSQSGVRWDTAFYDGKYYVYFGVLPVLIFYLPWYLITGCNFPTYIGCLICLAALIAGIGFLLVQLARRFFPHTSLGIITLCYLTVPFASLLAWITLNPNLYAMPVVLGLSCLCWGAYFYVRTDNHPFSAIPGSLLLACTFACRPQLGIFCILLVSFGIQALLARDGSNWKRSKPFYLACALLPFVIVGALLGWYNYARFGSPLDFGANYNITSNDMNLRPHNLEMALCGIYYYIVQLPMIEPFFPFVDIVNRDFPVSGLFVYEPMIGGILGLVPFTWFILALLGKRALAGTQVSCRMWKLHVIALALCVLIVAIFDSEAAGVLPRYMMDFAMPLAIFAALGLMCASSGEDASALRDEALSADASLGLKATSPRKWVARCALACFVAALVVYFGIAFYTGDGMPDYFGPASEHAKALVQSKLF